MEKSTIEGNHYFKYLSEKSFACCIFLLIPVIGNSVVWLFKMAKNPNDLSISEDRVNSKKDTPTIDTSNRLKSVECVAPWCNSNEPAILPQNWQKHTATQDLSIDYKGHEVKIPAGSRYFTFNGTIAIGWHGSYNPPHGM